MALGRKIEFESSQEQPSESIASPSIGRKIEFKDQDMNKALSLVNAFTKGMYKEFPEIAKAARPWEYFLPKTLQQQIYDKFVEERLPSQSGFAEEALERAGRIAPSAMIPGMGIGSVGRQVAGGAARSLLSGTLGQGIKEAGGGELAQAAGEMAAFAAPSFGRKIIPTKDQEKLINFARKTGMSEKEIAPLLAAQQKKAFYGKIAAKGEKAQEAIKASREAVSNAYDFVKASPEAKKSLSQQAIHKFYTDTNKIAKDIPFEIRKQLQQDFIDLASGSQSGENLINWYQDIGSRYKIGREHLERLKKPVLEAMESLAPELVEDFKLTNELWKRQIGIRKTLKPGLSSQLMDLGEIGKFAHAAMTLSVKGMAELLGIQGARRLAREMLINPRLQNLHKQMMKAANEGKLPLVETLAEYLKKQYQEKDQSPQR